MNLLLGQSIRFRLGPSGLGPKLYDVMCVGLGFSMHGPQALHSMLASVKKSQDDCLV